MTPHGIPCNDAAGEVVDKGEQVRPLDIGDRVAPIIDTENLTGQESTRSWLAADEDGVLADYLIFDERVLCKLPDYLDWTQASIVPCAGVTAWTAMKDFGIGKSVLIQGMLLCTIRIHLLIIARYRRCEHVRPETGACGWAQDLLNFVQ